MSLKVIFLISILAFSCLALSFDSVSAKDDWVAPARDNHYEAGYDHWIIPTENEWTVRFGRDGRLIAHQRLYDTQTGELIYDGHGDSGTIDRSHLYHELLYTIKWDGVPIDNSIIIPFYAGGDVFIYSDLRASLYKASWTINHYANENIGNATGIGQYELPSDAWSNLPE